MHGPKGSGKRAPALDAAALQRAAIDHLSRYVASREQLRRVLRRRLDRAEQRAPNEPQDRAAVLARIEELLDALEAQRVLDDGVLARALAFELLRRGDSRALVRGKLRARGLTAEHIDGGLEDALERLGADGDDPALVAATAYARRRRLGPFRADAEQRALRRDKDLAALARRGFPFGVARKVIEAEDAEQLPAAPA